LADERDTRARTERSDAALVAQYIHDLSERHVADAQAARSAGAAGTGSGTIAGEADGS
jgi:hypothetical protein